MVANSCRTTLWLYQSQISNLNLKYTKIDDGYRQRNSKTTWLVGFLQRSIQPVFRVCFHYRALICRILIPQKNNPQFKKQKQARISLQRQFPLNHRCRFGRRFCRVLSQFYLLFNWIRKNSETNEQSMFKRLTEFYVKRNQEQWLQKYHKRSGRNYDSRSDRFYFLLWHVWIHAEIVDKPITWVSDYSWLCIKRGSGRVEFLGCVISFWYYKDPSPKRGKLQSSFSVDTKIELQRV